MPHVPTVDIRRLGDIRFDTQLEKALAPSPDYDVQQWLFVPNEYTEYRYILGTRGKKPLICIGINPSTARPGDLDPTLKSVERVARNNGFDSFIMFNVYAQRATSPDDMEPECNPELHRENMRVYDRGRLNVQTMRMEHTALCTGFYGLFVNTTGYMYGSNIFFYRFYEFSSLFRCDAARLMIGTIDSKLY